MNLLKKLIVFLFNIKLKVVLNKKIKNIYQGITKKTIKQEILMKHQQLWSGLHSNPNLKWMKAYISINEKQDYRYITEYDYYAKIELCLNNRVLSEAYSDKNQYHQFIDNHYLPSVYIRNREGVFYTEDYDLLPPDFLLKDCIKSEAVIVKHALETGGGKGINKFIKNRNEWIGASGEILSKDFLVKNYKKNFIIQEYITQHTFYSQFNTSSLNTVRIFIYRSVKNNEIISLHSVLRIGAKGAIVDNQASGGIAVGIDEKGTLSVFGVNKYAQKFNSFNGITFSEIGKMYKFDEMKTMCKHIALAFPYHRLLGFDCCVNEKGEIKLIEVNNKNNEINFYQFNNGPLFREYTEEIIDYYNKNKRTYVFDFSI